MRSLILALTVLLAPHPVAAQDQTGRFDYYVLALGWQPSWCRQTGDDRAASECADGTARDFSVHGLWPQYERGWPERCATTARDPSRRESQGMTDIMGSGGLALYQWRKHGRCTGLSAAEYYRMTREALATVAIPEVFDDLGRDIRLPPAVVEEAVLEANPDLGADGVTVTCRGDTLAEIRICLTRDLRPRNCAPDVRRDCTRPRVLMEAVR